MVVPFIPTPVPSGGVVNPAIGSSGAAPIAYISNTEFNFAPTGMATTDLVKGGNNPAASTQSLADTIRRATRWCNSICFGSKVAASGASLAANLTVDSATIRIKSGSDLRLICDFTPLVQLVGVAVGSGVGNLVNLDPTLIGLARPGRHTWTIPFGGLSLVFRTGDTPAYVPGGYGAGSSVYTVWSYVSGFPHTKLIADITEGDTSCVVAATDGNGGMWATIAASGAFPGTPLTVRDQQKTETVFVQGITPNTPSTGQTTLTTTPFEFGHEVPALPDFIPVTAMPDDIQQAVIYLTMFLIKTRGARGFVMPSAPGGRPQQQASGQAGTFEDYENAHRILSAGGYITRVRHGGTY